jgi:hypothetical protein
MPGVPRYSITGPIGPEQIDYDMVPGADPRDALLTVHCDGLGSRRVRLEGKRFVFAQPADRELCAGAWEVTPIANNGTARRVTITIPAVDRGAGQGRHRCSTGPTHGVALSGRELRGG